MCENMVHLWLVCSYLLSCWAWHTQACIHWRRQMSWWRLCEAEARPEPRHTSLWREKECERREIGALTVHMMQCLHTAAWWLFLCHAAVNIIRRPYCKWTVPPLQLQYEQPTSPAHAATVPQKMIYCRKNSQILRHWCEVTLFPLLIQFFHPLIHTLTFCSTLGFTQREIVNGLSGQVEAVNSSLSCPIV